MAKLLERLLPDLLIMLPPNAIDILPTVNEYAVILIETGRGGEEYCIAFWNIAGVFRFHFSVIIVARWFLCRYKRKQWVHKYFPHWQFRQCLQIRPEIVLHVSKDVYT